MYEEGLREGDPLFTEEGKDALCHPERLFVDLTRPFVGLKRSALYLSESAVDIKESLSDLSENPLSG